MADPDPPLYTVEHLRPLDEPQGEKTFAKDLRRAGRIVRSARELRSRQFPPISFIVPGYIAEGCTLLAGRPKLGKSWLVLEMCLGVSMGALCLGGIKCEEGDVLYLALEDNERRLQRRIDKVLGPIKEWPARFYYATEWARSNKGGIDAIEKWMLSVEKPRLIVVDVLAMFRPAGGAGDNLYEADYNAIKGLQALASKHAVAIIIVHHTRKAGSDADPIEKVSGTHGLSGAADTTMVLDRDGMGATIYGRGRDIEEIESAVEFDRTSCRWWVKGEAADVRRSDARSQISRSPRWCGQPDGPDRFGGPDRQEQWRRPQAASHDDKGGGGSQNEAGQVYPPQPGGPRYRR